MREQFNIAVTGIKRGIVASAFILPVMAGGYYAQGIKEGCDQRNYSMNYCLEAARAGLMTSIQEAFSPRAGRYLADDYKYRLSHPTPRAKGLTVTNATMDMG